MSLTVIDHPIAGNFLNRLRECTTSWSDFRPACDCLTTFLAIEATRSLATESIPVVTPMETLEAPAVSQEVVVVAILRAGLGMIDPFLRLVPNASVGFVGMERDEETAEAHTYYSKLPPITSETKVIVVDPMLATGGSAEFVLNEVYRAGARDVAFACIVAAPEGVDRLSGQFPELPIFTAALDRELNASKYILPGLGDFGDRLYGT